MLISRRRVPVWYALVHQGQTRRRQPKRHPALDRGAICSRVPSVRRFLLILLRDQGVYMLAICASLPDVIRASCALHDCTEGARTEQR